MGTAIEIPLCEWNPDWFKHGLNKKFPTTSSWIHSTKNHVSLHVIRLGSHQENRQVLSGFHVVIFAAKLRIWHGKTSKVCDLKRLTHVLEELPLPTEARHGTLWGEMSWLVRWFCWISASSPCHGCIDAICIYVFFWGGVAWRDIL